MANVAVQKRPEERESILGLFEETRKVFDSLQKRAYDLFQQRGGGFGADMDDWFRAERELLNLPASDLTEDDAGFHLKASVPGIRAKDLEITVTPRELLIRGKSDTEEKRKEGKALMKERCHNEIFRRYSLPAAIELDKVSAKVDDGLLTVEMPKAAVKKVPVSEKAAA